MIIHHCYVYEGSDDHTDFETNHKSDAIEVDKVFFGANGVEFLKNEDYSTFKSNIDGQTIVWSDVKYKEYPNFYELFLEV